MNYYRVLDETPPFSFLDARDLRTAVDFGEVDTRFYNRVGTYHNALDDCIFQVKYLVDCANVCGAHKPLKRVERKTTIDAAGVYDAVKRGLGGFETQISGGNNVYWKQ